MTSNEELPKTLEISTVCCIEIVNTHADINLDESQRSEDPESMHKLTDAILQNLMKLDCIDARQQEEGFVAPNFEEKEQVD